MWLCRKRPRPTVPSNVRIVPGRLRLKCDGTRAEIRFRLSAKRTSPFKSAGASVQLTTGSRGVRISGSNAGYTMFHGRVKSTGYPLHSPVSPSLPHPFVTVCHHISTGLYILYLVPSSCSYQKGSQLTVHKIVRYNSPKIYYLLRARWYALNEFIAQVIINFQKSRMQLKILGARRVT